MRTQLVGKNLLRRPALALVSSIAIVAATMLLPATAEGATAFSNTTLFATGTLASGITTSPVENSTGNSEPGIAFGSDGAMAIDSLAWLPFQVNMWQGTFGSTPDFFGGMDTNLTGRGAGRAWLGDGDADVAITDAGTTLLADLDFIVNRPFNRFQTGVSVTRCPAGSNDQNDCTTKFLDLAGVDRPWIATVGTTAWVSYHDSANSTLIRVMKSTNDGRSWSPAASPIPGQADLTATCTFNGANGPIVADPSTGNEYSIYVCGDTVTKGLAFTGNNIIVSRSTDGGAHYRAFTVFHGPRDTALANLFASLAVDPSNGTLYATWTDTKDVWVSTSVDNGRTWSAPADVSTAQTTVMPWVAALDGKVDVVYYGSSAASFDDQSAVWNVYDSQWLGGAWTVKQVSNTPNRVGAVCLNGSGCEADRELLDLFEVAEDPLTGQAAVVYTDTTISTWTQNSESHELPEIVIAFEN